MGKPTYNRLIMTGEDLRDGIDRGMGVIYDVARTAYGVRSGNVMIENRADAPTISHDGVSNIAVLERSDPIEDMAISCRLLCICPPGTKHKCTERRDIPGSNAFVPSVAGLIIASEIIKDLTQEATARARAAIA